MTNDDTRRPDDSAPEFDRFADLAKRLAKVSKKELDEARERERLAKG